MVYIRYLCCNPLVKCMIDFSIVIPHYNIPKCLEKLINSIPLEDNIEIIVVDDKSDKDLELLEQCKTKYEADNCRFYTNDTEHKGAGICRNIGISKARGKWLLFADSDDFFSEDMYEILVSNKDREEDIIFFYPDSINLDTGLKADRHVEFCNVLKNYEDNASEYNELVLRYQVVSPWSKMIRKAMVDDYKIEFEGTRVANDVLFCRKIGYHAKKIAVDSRTIYYVTERQGSLVTLMNKDAYYTRLRVFLNSSRYVKGVINRESWKKLNTNGGYFIHMCRKNKLGLGTMIKTVFMCCSYGIKPL